MILYQWDLWVRKCHYLYKISATIQGDNCKASAQNSQLFCGTKQVIFCYILMMASSTPGRRVDFLCHHKYSSRPGSDQLLSQFPQFHKSSCLVSRSHTHLNYLNTKLVVKVANVEHVWPKSLPRGKWVNSDAGAHLLKVPSKLGVFSNLLLVFSCKCFQISLEAWKLAGQFCQLRIQGAIIRQRIANMSSKHLYS